MGRFEQEIPEIIGLSFSLNERHIESIKEKLDIFTAY